MIWGSEFLLSPVHPGLCAIVAPITILLSKDTTFKSTHDCANAFAMLRRVVASSPILRHYDLDTRAELRRDASGDSIAADATQRGED